jgi:hypothetical protein
MRPLPSILALFTISASFATTSFAGGPVVSRIISSGDDLPVTGTYASGNAPAIASDGSIVARITGNFGGGKLGAIFTKSGAGAAALPAVQGGAAPGVTDGKFARFFDPIIARNGRYAFVATLSGVPAAKAGGVWSTIEDDTLKLEFQKGTPLPGTTENIVSIMNIAMSDQQLFALVKLDAPPTRNVALIFIAHNDGNRGVIARTGDPITAGTLPSSIPATRFFSLPHFAALA